MYYICTRGHRNCSSRIHALFEGLVVSNASEHKIQWLITSHKSQPICVMSVHHKITVYASRQFCNANKIDHVVSSDKSSDLHSRDVLFGTSARTATVVKSVLFAVSLFRQMLVYYAELKSGHKSYLSYPFHFVLQIYQIIWSYIPYALNHWSRR